MTPALVELVTRRRFPDLLRRNETGWWTGLFWTLGATVVAAVVMGLVYLPLLRSGIEFGDMALAAVREHPHGIDLGALKPNLAARLRTPDQQVQAAPALLLSDLPRFAAQPQPAADELLLIGRRHVRSNNSWMHNYHRLVKGKPRHQLLMHPDDLAVRGLADGQRVCVRSRVGSLEVEVASSSDMMPGVVSLPHGWGHGRQGVQLAIARAQPGASANDLTDERLLDALSGNAALNGVPVEVLSA